MPPGGRRASLAWSPRTTCCSGTASSSTSCGVAPTARATTSGSGSASTSPCPTRSTRPTRPTVDAARRIDALHNRLFLDPIFRGTYPEDLLADTAHLDWQGGHWHDVVHDGDLAVISSPIDVLGVNYYHGNAVSGHPHEAVVGIGSDQPDRVAKSPFVGSEHVTFPSRGLPLTDMGWEVQPEGLHRLLRRLHDDYPRLPIYLTETGAAYPDVPGPDGQVHDLDRIDFLDSYLRAVHRAIEEGVDVRGFFQWSFMDNFEWAFGYAKRFGLVHVDYATQQRTPKASARWYAEVARSGGLPAAGSPGPLA